MGTTKFQGEERRERYRVPMGTKVLVEAQDPKPFSEVGSLINMTRTGVYFEGFGDYHRGMTVKVLFPYNPAQPPQERPRHAEVVRVQEIEGSFKKGVAVRLLNIFLKP